MMSLIASRTSGSRTRSRLFAMAGGPSGAAPSLAFNALWKFAGNVTYAGCQWAILILMTKLGTPQMVGQFALGMAVAAPVMIFFNFSLRTVQATDARREFPFREYFGLRLTTTAAALVVIAAIAPWATQNRATRLVIVIVGIAKCVESIGDLLYGCMQQHEHLDYVGRSMMLRGGLAVLAVGTTLYLTNSIAAATLALACAWAVAVVSYDAPMCARILHAEVGGAASRLGELRPRLHVQCMVRLALNAGPLGAVAMLNSLSSNFPRYFVERYLGTHELGVFAAMAYLMLAGNTVANALSDSSVPRLAKYYAARDRTAFVRMVHRLVLSGAAVGGVAVLAAAIAGRQILTIIYRPEYARHADVFVWIMAAAGLLYVDTFLAGAAASTRAFRQLMLPYFVSAMVAGTVSALLIPRFGLRGAAWALLSLGVTNFVMPIMILIRTGRTRFGAQQVDTP